MSKGYPLAQTQHVVRLSNLLGVECICQVGSPTA